MGALWRVYNESANLTRSVFDRDEPVESSLTATVFSIAVGISFFPPAYDRVIRPYFPRKPILFTDLSYFKLLRRCGPRWMVLSGAFLATSSFCGVVKGAIDAS